jgi:hypothetical protein
MYFMGRPLVVDLGSCSARFMATPFVAIGGVAQSYRASGNRSHDQVRLAAVDDRVRERLVR